MSNIIMPNILTRPPAGAAVDSNAQVSSGKEGSFSQHLQRKVNADKVVKDNVVGGSQQARDSRAEKQKEGEERTPASVEALLQQVMQYLQDMLKKSESEEGKWTFQLKDMGILEKLAAQAGMDAATLAALKKQMEGEGFISLADLFAALEKNFQQLDTPTKVTASETYLPLLDSMLSRLGVSPESIKQLEGKGVNGLDRLDLAAFLEGLKEISAADRQGDATSFVLTDWEREQLSAMLAEAGVSPDTISSMFPEVMTAEQMALADLGPGEGNNPVAMTLERLQALLQQALSAAEEARPKADLPGFLQSLQLVMGQSGLRDQGVGWNPVVQGSMQAVYDQLQTMVDLSTVKVESAGNSATGGSPGWQEVAEWAQKREALLAEAMGGDEVAGQQGAGSGDSVIVSAEMAGGEVNDVLADSTIATNTNRSGTGEGALFQGPEARMADQSADLATKGNAPRIRFTPEMQQFTVEQISQGVLRGLRNNDHHLALTLYPKELGEVKVDLQVRGSQLSVTFVMENQKVKEALESNMGDFKDNLERRGFTLGAMAVSVDQQYQSPDDGKRFSAAWETMMANRSQQEKILTPGATLAELGQAGQTLPLHGGISLFV